jgi:hypothetical protein
MNEQRAVIQQMVDALDHADELLGGNDTLVMNGAAAGRWLLEQPAVQEPVAWMQDSIELYVQDRPSAHYTIPLYTTPPTPQPVPVKTYHDGKPWPVAPKPWVGLTDEDIEQGHKESWVDKQAFESAVWWAEKKLKEKNL